MTERKSVLIVDDYQRILISFKRVLEKEGFTVETVETGKEAAEKIRLKHYNIVLIDVKLPDVEGTDLLLQMRNIPETIKIIVTGFSSSEIGTKASDYGADDYLVKPVSMEELLETIND